MTAYRDRIYASYVSGFKGQDVRFDTVAAERFGHELAFTPGLPARLLTMAGFTWLEARELGPIPRGYSLAASVRSAAWTGIRLACDARNLIETGGRGERIPRVRHLRGATVTPLIGGEWPL